MEKNHFFMLRIKTIFKEQKKVKEQHFGNLPDPQVTCILVLEMRFLSFWYNGSYIWPFSFKIQELVCGTICFDTSTRFIFYLLKAMLDHINLLAQFIQITTPRISHLKDTNKQGPEQCKGLCQAMKFQVKLI